MEKKRVVFFLFLLLLGIPSFSSSVVGFNKEPSNIAISNQDNLSAVSASFITNNSLMINRSNFRVPAINSLGAAENAKICMDNNGSLHVVYMQIEHSLKSFIPDKYNLMYMNNISGKWSDSQEIYSTETEISYFTAKVSSNGTIWVGLNLGIDGLLELHSSYYENVGINKMEWKNSTITDLQVKFDTLNMEFLNSTIPTFISTYQNAPGPDPFGSLIISYMNQTINRTTISISNYSNGTLLNTNTTNSTTFTQPWCSNVTVFPSLSDISHLDITFDDNFTAHIVFEGVWEDSETSKKKQDIFYTSYHFQNITSLITNSFNITEGGDSYQEINITTNITQLAGEFSGLIRISNSDSNFSSFMPHIRSMGKRRYVSWIQTESNQSNQTENSTIYYSHFNNISNYQFDQISPIFLPYSVSREDYAFEVDHKDNIHILALLNYRNFSQKEELEDYQNLIYLTNSSGEMIPQVILNTPYSLIHPMIIQNLELYSFSQVYAYLAKNKQVSSTEPFQIYYFSQNNLNLPKSCNIFCKLDGNGISLKDNNGSIYINVKEGKKFSCTLEILNPYEQNFPINMTSQLNINNNVKINSGESKINHINNIPFNSSIFTTWDMKINSLSFCTVKIEFLVNQVFIGEIGFEIQISPSFKVSSPFLIFIGLSGIFTMIYWIYRRKN